MASRRSSYGVGSKPPTISWTMVRGDSASFKAYVTDDSKNPLVISDWDILMKIKRPNISASTPVITDNAELVLTLIPAAEIDELPGYFTVSLTPEQTLILETGDIFDIQLTQIEQNLVWTVAQGSMVILEDVTD